MGQHRHPAHRVAHQDHRTPRNHHLQNGFQILAELLDGVGLDRGFTGLAMPTLVVEDHPDLLPPALGQGGPLKVERAHPLTESVREDHRQRGGHRTHLADDQRDTVGGGDHTPAVGVQQREILALVGVANLSAPPPCLGGRPTGRSADRPDSGDPGQQTCLPADLGSRSGRPRDGFAVVPPGQPALAGWLTGRHRRLRCKS